MQVEEIFIWRKKKTQRKTGEFCYSMAFTIRPLVAQPIKMQDLH